MVNTTTSVVVGGVFCCNYAQRAGLAFVRNLQLHIYSNVLLSEIIEGAAFQRMP